MNEGAIFILILILTMIVLSYVDKCSLNSKIDSVSDTLLEIFDDMFRNDHYIYHTDLENEYSCLLPAVEVECSILNYNQTLLIHKNIAEALCEKITLLLKNEYNYKIFKYETKITYRNLDNSEKMFYKVYFKFKKI